jgi:hypothetical protein
MSDLTSILDAKRAVERVLKGTNLTTPIAYENIKFDPPASGMYITCQFQIQRPTDPVFNAGYHRENIEFQVFVVDDINAATGTTAGFTRALQIRNTFKKGTTFQEGDTRIHILETPQVAGSMQLNNKMWYPIIIPLLVEVENYSAVFTEADSYLLLEA